MSRRIQGIRDVAKQSGKFIPGCLEVADASWRDIRLPVAVPKGARFG